MTDILLINLPFETKLSEKMVSNFEFCPSIGLLQLYSYLTLNGYNAVIHEFTLYKMKKQEFLDYIDELQPRAIGISAYTENIYLA